MTSGYLHNWRDSEGKGLIGCMFFIVVFALAIYLGIMLGPVYYANFNFESQIETEAGRAGAKFLDDETIIKDILDLAKRNEIRLNRQNIKIDRFAGQVHIDVQYSVPVDFGFFVRNLDFRVEASSFIGTL
ncbi:MAG: DUF4845 domain-containing protein [Acidobacteria bacterium]|nr:DUF4845 domain-containing protein [Acidobacteriota bacterium]